MAGIERHNGTHKGRPASGNGIANYLPVIGEKKSAECKASL